MEKILTIGDIHGKDIWKKLTLDTYDKVIFIGDYVDDWHATDKMIVDNLLDIIEFKKSNEKNIILLIGNHELNYYPKFGYKLYGSSGFRPTISSELQNIYSKHRRLFQYSYQIDTETRNYLWTHAGVSKGWYSKHFAVEFDQYNTILEEELTLSDKLNMLFAEKFDCMTQVGWERGGYSKYGSPLWADKSEFLSNGIPLRGYHQIVGHNKVKDILIHTMDNDTEIVFTDCLESKEKGYILEI